MSDAVKRGILQWNYTGVKYPNIKFNSLTYTTSRNYTIVVLIGDYGGDGYHGGCIFYTSNGTRVNPEIPGGGLYPSATRDWNYCIIRIHTNHPDVQSRGYDAIKALGAHESGHALGLRHCDIISHEAIMFNDAIELNDNRHVSAPSDKDRQLLLNLYDVIPS